MRQPNLALIFCLVVFCFLDVCFCCVRFSFFSISQEIGLEECMSEMTYFGSSRT